MSLHRWDVHSGICTACHGKIYVESIQCCMNTGFLVFEGTKDLYASFCSILLKAICCQAFLTEIQKELCTIFPSLSLPPLPPRHLPGTEQLTTLFYPQIQITAPYGLLWRKLTSSQTDPVQLYLKPKWSSCTYWLIHFFLLHKNSRSWWKTVLHSFSHTPDILSEKQIITGRTPNSVMAIVLLFVVSVIAKHHFLLMESMMLS